MIALLTGTLTAIGQNEAVIVVGGGGSELGGELGGVGYHFHASRRCLAQLSAVSGAVTVLIDTQIRDDRIILTGFADSNAKQCFHLLQSVQGVGMKAALAILSVLSPDDIILAISAGDKAMLSRADGVGAKLAARIINELAEKIGGVSDTSITTNAVGSVSDTTPDPTTRIRTDAISALHNLGYSRGEAHNAVMRVAHNEGDTMTLEALIPLALKELGR